MANVLTHNPWKLDTAAAITVLKLRVKRIAWVGPTGAGDVATLHDRLGRVVWTRNAEAASVDVVENAGIAECPGQDWDGLTVPTGGVPSGALYLTYE